MMLDSKKERSAEEESSGITRISKAPLASQIFARPTNQKSSLNKMMLVV
jgi:hypothetical protein